MKVLYIEDNPTAVKTVQRITSLIDYECVVAMTGTEGLERLAESPEIVLVDMELPDYDGITLVKEIRRRFPKLPIIVITGFALAGEREQWFEAGCTDYFRKP